MEIDFDTVTIAEIVKSNYAASKHLERHGIDFCCGGDVSFNEACAKAGVSPDDLKTELHQVMNQAPSTQPDFETWPLDLICDYLEKKHHRYVRDAGPRLLAILDKLCDVHGNEAPWLFGVRSAFSESLDQLKAHMVREEKDLFEPIRNWQSDQNNESLKAPIQAFISEHETEGSRYKSLREITSDYTSPEWGCTTFHLGMKLLNEFERDLHLHVHIENNILFPRVLSKIEETTASL